MLKSDIQYEGKILARKSRITSGVAESQGERYATGRGFFGVTFSLETSRFVRFLFLEDVVTLGADLNYLASIQGFKYRLIVK